MRRSWLVLVTACAAIVAVLPLRGADATTSQQFVWFDQDVTHSVNTYFQPAQSAATPPDWTSPVNYVSGKVYTRIDITSKPTTKPLDIQICVWRNNWTEETCSSYLRVTTAGTYYHDFGSVGKWWKLGGSFSWSTPFSPVRLMVKDPDTGLLFMTGSCGAHCSTPEAVNGHVPIRANVSAVVVASGSTLQPPATWAGCPTAWSATCASPTTSTSATTTAPTTTTTTTTEPTTTTTTVVPGGERDVALVVGDAANALVGDAPLRSRLTTLGWNVTLVDDDSLTSATALDGAELAVISSSIVPSKVPAWLASSPVPILNAEAYAQYHLRLATSPTEQGNQTSVSVLAPDHPLAAGRSGTLVVQGAASMGWGRPVAGATVVASLVGASAPSVYGIETGTTLVSGTSAPARRVGFFTSYASQSKLTADGWALFDAAVGWLAT